MEDKTAAENQDIELETKEAQEAELDVEETNEENIEDIKDQLLRALAEMENIRKRAIRDRDETSKYAITNFARLLLSVSDNLRRALDALPEDQLNDLPKEVQSFVEGVQLTETELLNIFEKSGIKKITPMGEAFDHAFHQAMFEVETSDHPAGTIVEVLQAGYVLDERLLRPDMVGVEKAKS